MSAKSQLYQAMQSIWDRDSDKIIEELSNEDGWEDRIEWARKTGEPLREEDATDEEIISAIMQDLYSDFMSDFNHKAEEDAGDLLIYRCLSVDDQEEFVFYIANGQPVENYEGGHYEGLGIFWAWDEDRAQCHWGSGRGAGNVTVNARVPFSSIDPYVTLVLNLNPSLGKDEAEIRLKEGADLEVLGVDTNDGYVSPLDHGEKPIPMTAIRAFEERPMPVGPEPDGNFDRENQMVEIGMPEMNTVPLKEALMVRPYYLDREEKFMPDPVKCPGLHRVLSPEFAKPELPPVQPKVEETAPAEPVADEALKENKE